MKLALYGMPCAGKTTLLKTLASNIKVVAGGSWLRQAAGGSFDSLSESAKEELRLQYTDYLNSLADISIISDGHYAFRDRIVFTAKDAELYDAFIYLYCKPEILRSRLQASSKNHKFAALTQEALAAWQSREIEGLRKACHSRNKDFYVINSERITQKEFQEFIKEILSGYSSYGLALEIFAKIRHCFPLPQELEIVDGDKTLISEDSFRLCSGDYKIDAFDGNFYTGYQSFEFAQATQKITLDYTMLKHCTLNKAIVSRLHKEKCILLSAGITALWQRLAKYNGFPYAFASPLISADTKYFLGKLLQQAGYRITAYGDSKNDYYLLQQADKGYLCLGKRLSRSLEDCDASGLELFLEPEQHILSEANPQEFAEEIAICKSSSGISGPKLAQAHFDLGRKLGAYMRHILPHKNIPLLVLDRGGRFFGDGLYIGFGGILHPFNPKKEPLPNINSNLIIIVDSVINTGNTLERLIKELKKRNPCVSICLATNVIQRAALARFKELPLFAIRVSDNKYIGKKQSFQDGDSGPDTADRLFNLI